jgi:hypothetical protein
VPIGEKNRHKRRIYIFSARAGIDIFSAPAGKKRQKINNHGISQVIILRALGQSIFLGNFSRGNFLKNTNMLVYWAADFG